jgi:two-component system, chemotaxis family, protein-glutamate methylesterase/glutaminase
MDTSATVRRDIVVIGASSGGIEALTELVGALPVGLPAAIYIVQHVSASSPGVLAGILQRASRNPVRAAGETEPIAIGEIRVAPPDHHLVLTPDGVRLDRGPKENRVRPAIDVLFRSAALAFGPRVIGVVLTGNLSDEGLRAIKACAGLSVIQRPDDAAFPDMPRNAIAKDSPDAILPLAEIGPALVRMVGQIAPAQEMPAALALEAPLGYRLGEVAIAMNDQLGSSAPFICTDCGGPLWEVDTDTLRFRCVIGHALDSDALLAGKSEEIARALVHALRALDEKARLLGRMAQQQGEERRSLSAESFRRKHTETSEAAALVRRLVDSLGTDGER